MILNYDNTKKMFYLKPCDMHLSDIGPVKSAGFTWYDEKSLWVSGDRYRAAVLSRNDSCHTSESTVQALSSLTLNNYSSRSISTDTDIICPTAQEYMNFQIAGAEAIGKRLSTHKAALLADPMGVGKTIQACALINYNLIDPSRVLVVGPASLRLNWARELNLWLVWDSTAIPILRLGDGIDTNRTGPLVVSYDMLLNDSVFGWITSCPWELIIFDESQYLKNAEAQRTQRCLAPGGVADRANKILLMSGTPIPNAAHEFHSTLSTVAPDVTGGMSSYQFSNRYTTGVQGEYGWQVTGGRNAEELGWRLRGSGFMVRRKKRSVLPQLPPERHQLIIFPQNQGTAAVIKKEQDNIPFTAQEILDAGKPLGYGAIPELRHEMGLEKMPDCISWVKDQLDGGLEKIVLFGYHQDVLEGMYKGLEKYKPLLVYGPTPMTQRQAAVDAFQHDEAYRVIIGGWKPLGTGWTLTAADTAAFVESSFVPGDNDQCKDRLPRIGTKASCINIYHLVVEGSTDASVLSKAAGKQYHTDKVLN